MREIGDFMTLDSIIDGIITRKELLHATNQQIADASGVSLSTVNRILRKQEGYIPTIQTLLDIATAVGYEFSDPEREPVEVEGDARLREIIRVYEEKCKLLENESRLKTVQYNLAMAEKDRVIDTKDKWVNRLFNSLVALGLGIIIVLLIDICVRGIGWFP